MNHFTVISIITIALSSLITNNQTNEKATKEYSGVYSYGDLTGSGPNGQIIIYPESDDSVLFYMAVSNGEPSYNMGSLYDRVKIQNGYGVYFNKYDFAETGCKWSFTFKKDHLIVETIDNNYECGFGGNVIADGDYKRVKKSQDYFEDFEGNKYFFQKDKPPKWN